MAEYFALTKETLQDVLRYLSKTDATASLYEKVSQALKVQEAAPQPETEPTALTTPDTN